MIRSPLQYEFPFLFGGTFIEAIGTINSKTIETPFPFLFGGTFIEARRRTRVLRLR